jgi:hypothetical protein
MHQAVVGLDDDDLGEIPFECPTPKLAPAGAFKAPKRDSVTVTKEQTTRRSPISSLYACAARRRLVSLMSADTAMLSTTAAPAVGGMCGLRVGQGALEGGPLLVRHASGGQLVLRGDGSSVAQCLVGGQHDERRNITRIRKCRHRTTV